MVYLDFKVPVKKERSIIRFGKYGQISVNDAAKLCNKSVKTIRKWMEHGWPKLEESFVRLHVCGQLIPTSWRGAYFKDEKLIVSEEIEVSFKDLRIILESLKRKRALGNMIPDSWGNARFKKNILILDDTQKISYDDIKKMRVDNLILRQKEKQLNKQIHALKIKLEKHSL